MINSLGNLLNFLFVFLRILDRNLPTTNAGRPVKRSKYADFRLVFFLKKHITPSCGWGSDEVGQKKQTCPDCDVTDKKLRSKTFQIFLIDSVRPASSLEDLNRSLAQPAGESWAIKPGQTAVVKA